jgi:hypothetical protein
MSRGAGAALVAVSAVYLLLILAAASKLGASYEEVVPYVLSRLDIRNQQPTAAPDQSPPRFVVSPQLPVLAFEAAAGLQLPLLNQPYMTDHLSYGGVALAAAGVDGLWAARAWHALFGAALLWILYDVALLLGLGRRAALFAVAIAATSLPYTFMYSWARFDESLPSAGTVVVLWAALRYARSPRPRWVWVGMAAAAIAISAKLTALWPLAGLALAGALAGWRPPPMRSLAWPALVVAPLFAPMLGFAVATPTTGHEVNRRLAFLTDLFTSDVIPGTAANLIGYLGSWGSILSEAMGPEAAAGTNVVGELLVTCTLIWLVVRALRPNAVARRHRLEAQMLAVVAVVFILVTLFYREHRDYQFVLLVPLHALALAGFLDFLARRLQHHVPSWAASAVVLALPVAANLWDQRHFRLDLDAPDNAMFDLHVQRASAAWLAAHGVQRPIVTTFYAVGTYELFTAGRVRPIYTFPLMRHSNDGSDVPDLAAVWRALLAEDGDRERYALLPLGTNPIEARHFDEPAIHTALLETGRGERVAVFNNRRDQPLLEIWRVNPRVVGATGSESR